MRRVVPLALVLTACAASWAGGSESGAGLADAPPDTHVSGAAIGPLPMSLPLPEAPAAPRLAVVVSIDGLRPDAIGGSTPTLLRLGREGVLAGSASTIDRSTTLPSHASMVSGFGIETHGVRWNAHAPNRGPIRVPTIFTAARRAGLSASMFVGKRKLEHLAQSGELDRFESHGIFCRNVNAAALPYLREAPPGVHFVHYADVDGAGHYYGWMTPQYHETVQRADECLGQLVQTLEARGDLDRTLLIVTSDHGGHGRTHGSERPEDTRIPWIAWGGAVRAGGGPTIVSTLDTAATVLDTLGLPGRRDLEGRPVTLR